MPEYCIQAAMFRLPIPYFDRFVHDFWILRDLERNTVIAQIHGLATSRSNGYIVPIGYSRDHSLRAYCITYDPSFAIQYGLQRGNFALPIHDYCTVYQKEDCVQHWLRSMNAVKAINDLDLDYPLCGFKIPLSATINSNSVYHTFAQVMDIPLHAFDGFFHIGLEASLYDQIKHRL
ncbi:Uncharacterised protein [Legionella steigerwaltii]|uniref:Uncharacterized protein n=1 Tax=Legionella steigerwaltii TaxID=460 RepID=A0A378L4L0_9GAMM|nr:hypothetical protein [Legionella steigerwaltii]KTD77419.1 hypothetical protein Lstg_1776 [Legionella steigerwaltii]STY21714.1 Uncharacterised protein [Legionella steigerwaltii]